MAITSSVAVAIALQAEHQARVAHCEIVTPTFNAQSATVSEMREYAGCVETLHPNPISADMTIALKALFVIALIGIVIGVMKSRKDAYPSNWVDHCVFGFFGFIILPGAAVFIVGILWGIKWLLA